MKRAFWSVLGLCTVPACALQIHLTVMPEKIPPVSPPIQARGLLLIAPSFEEYFSEGKAGFHKIRTHYGEAAATALSALVTASFAAAEIKRLADVEVQTLLDGAADTSVADLLLVPFFESADARGRVTTESPSFDAAGNVVVGASTYDEMAEVKLRLNVRSFRTGSTFTWVTSGGGEWGPGGGAAATFALEATLHSLSDSLAAHRAELELVGPAR